MHTGLINTVGMNHLKKKKSIQNFRNKDAILKRDDNYSLQFLFGDHNNSNNNNKNK